MKGLLIIMIVFTIKGNLYVGYILRVIDGDTFVLQTEEGNLRIRMDGIDAPERDQVFGTEARDFLNGFLYDKAVVFPKGIDKYGRTIGILFVNGININLLEIREGYAWHYKWFSDDERLAKAEALARQEKKGLWGNMEVVPPWEWRRKRVAVEF